MSEPVWSRFWDTWSKPVSRIFCDTLWPCQVDFVTHSLTLSEIDFATHCMTLWNRFCDTLSDPVWSRFCDTLYDPVWNRFCDTLSDPVCMWLVASDPSQMNTNKWFWKTVLSVQWHNQNFYWYDEEKKMGKAKVNVYSCRTVPGGILGCSPVGLLCNKWPSIP